MIRLKHCTVEFLSDGVITRFPDGTDIEAQPHDTYHCHVISHRLGYGDNILRYCQEHEFAHSYIAECLFDRPSLVLSSLAHGVQLSGRNSAYEEIAAQVLQRWLRTHERPILSGVNWDRVKTEALGLLDREVGVFEKELFA